MLGVLGRGDFFGEGCLAGQSVRMGSVTTMIATTVLVIAKQRIAQLLQVRHQTATTPVFRR